MARFAFDPRWDDTAAPQGIESVRGPAQREFTNLHVPFPLVTRISPRVAHQAGTRITVHGSNFAPSALGGLPVIIYENFTVSDPTAPQLICHN